MKKRIISFLLVLCMVAAMLPVTALAAGSGTMDAPWESNGVKVSRQGSTLLVYGSGAMKDYASKTEPEWYSVSGEITRIVIEESVTRLGNNAFAACGSVATIQLKRNLTGALALGSNALPSVGNVELEVMGSDYMPDYDFNQPWANVKTRIVKVTIDEGVKSIGAQAFSGCTKLASVVIPGSAAYIGNEAFANCVSLTDVKLYHDFASNAVYPFTIADTAFPVGNTGFNMALEITGSTAIPDYANAEQQPWAFYRPYITALVIGGNVPRIGNNAFYDCKWLKSISLYFNEVSAQAQKEFGRDTFRYEGNKVLNVVAVSENLAFKNWTGATFASTTAENTQVYYNAQGMTVVANWYPVVRDLVLEPKTDMHYGDIELGYESIGSYQVEVTNKGNVPSGKLLIELSGGYPFAFVLNTQTIPSLNPNGKATFTVTPALGMAIGYYYTTVIVSDEEGTIATFEISFDVGTAYTRAARFVKRLYICALGRTPDAISENEINAYVEELVSQKTTASEVAAKFFTSDEFRARGLTNEEFVKALYGALLDRVPTAPELYHWMQSVNAGNPRNAVFGSFITSEEFKNMCAKDTILVGAVDCSKLDMSNRFPADEVTKKFVISLYEKLLDRQYPDYPSDADVVSWATILKNGSAAEVIAGFLASDEYMAKRKTDRDFVVDLYKVMTEHVPTEAELKFYTDMLGSGASRATVFNSFCTSAEFINICSGKGFAAGAIDPARFNFGPNYDDGKNFPKMTKDNAEAAITELYQAILGRTVGQADLDAHRGDLCGGFASHAQVAARVFCSDECMGHQLNNEQFVNALYKALLDRAPTAAELGNKLAALSAGTSRSAVFAELASTGEYRARCNHKGYTWSSIDPAAYAMNLPGQAQVVSDAAAESFVKNCYRIVLGREPQAAELHYWKENMKFGNYSAGQIAAMFFTSDEGRNHNQTNASFVRNVYSLLLGRAAADSEVIAQIDAILNGGARRCDVFAEVLKSEECVKHCNACGFTNGSIDPDAYNNMGSAADDGKFVPVDPETDVKHLYSVILGRTADQLGLEANVYCLNNGVATHAQTAAGLFSSAEGMGRRLSNEQFIRTVYKALLNRDPAKAELDAKLAALNDGISRAAVFAEVCNTADYKTFCATHGYVWSSIDPAKYPMDLSVPGPAVSDAAAGNFVKSCYQIILNRVPSEAELLYWKTNMMSGAYSAGQLAASFFASEECRSHNLSNVNFVKAVYRVLRNEEASNEDIILLAGSLAAGTKRSALFSEILQSPKCVSFCNGCGFTNGAIDPAAYDMGTASDDGKLVPLDPETDVKKLYLTILGRTADEEGLKANVYCLNNGITTYARAAADLFCSAEGMGRKLDNEAFVNALYQALLGRDPNPAEMLSDTTALGSGMSRSALFAQLCNSDEFKNFCAAHGYVWSSIDPKLYAMDLPKPQIFVTEAHARDFVLNCFAQIWKRSPAEGEADALIHDLMYGQQNAAQVAAYFFAHVTISQEDFVKALYQVLLHRAGGEAEVSAWLGTLADGATRSQVFVEFLKSQECSTYFQKQGLTGGSVDPAAYAAMD